MIPQPKHTAFVSSGDAVYLPMNTGEFTVTHCPDSFNLARRIAAAMNACAGKETKDLEAMEGKDIFTGNLFSKRVAMEKERDTYRDLCGELLEAMFKINEINNQIEICKILEDSIGKAKAILGEKKLTCF